MDADLKKLEEELQKLSPVALPEDLFSRLDEAMCKWHEKVPEEEKVVSFLPESTTVKRKFLSWSAAAAVAVLGGSIALWPSFSEPGGEVVAAGPSAIGSGVTQITTRKPARSSFVPIKATRNLVETSDRGIVSLADGRPARCLALQFQDERQFRNANGELLKVDRPAFKVVLIPLEAD